ncbi:uncharacterized protein P174DRAFT_367121 [Aspergillus novofumigatus IBT 16806]|uniref:Uncharacterized protein n=1 Tax=Aspergillus novofumigatus (strain IBT 16806) TaxID=1392255 RepID=A0A2I1CBC9_ASPN1|nr:uncharacterized protein P174DRAFT_367121 [Aspergillus novofumigatus IBT 16806]PKX94914.1 hypothetical protein P174DRAFT_367121 [Aspergillus novofumigatus IBT 16806]
MFFYWPIHNQLHYATVDQDCLISETFGAMLTAIMIPTNHFLTLKRRHLQAHSCYPDMDLIGPKGATYCALVEFHWRRYIRKPRSEAQPRCCLLARSPAWTG